MYNRYYMLSSSKNISYTVYCNYSQISEECPLLDKQLFCYVEMISPSNSLSLSLSLSLYIYIYINTHTHTKRKRERQDYWANQCRFWRKKSSTVFFLLGDSPESESRKRKPTTVTTRRKIEIKNKSSTDNRVCNPQIFEKNGNTIQVYQYIRCVRPR